MAHRIPVQLAPPTGFAQGFMDKASWRECVLKQSRSPQGQRAESRRENKCMSHHPLRGHWQIPVPSLGFPPALQSTTLGNRPVILWPLGTFEVQSIALCVYVWVYCADMCVACMHCAYMRICIVLYMCYLYELCMCMHVCCVCTCWCVYVHTVCAYICRYVL